MGLWGCSFITVTLLYSHCLQYLLYSVSSLLISMSLKTGALKPPRQSPATSCGVHICLWLSKEAYVGQHKAVPLLLLFDPSKLHVLKACNRPELHFAFVSHSSVPERTWPWKWMFRLCKHGKKTNPSISVLFYIKWLLLFLFLWLCWIKLAFGCVLLKPLVNIVATAIKYMTINKM